MNHNLAVLGILCLVIAGSEYLVRTTICKHLGSALLVIILGALLANLKIIPSASNSIPLYDIIFQQVAPLALFYLLLGVNIRSLRHAGVPMLLMFLIGTMGTMTGVWLSMKLLVTPQTFGEWGEVIAGMFAATYTGGGLNFNTVALHYEIMEEGVLFAGAVAVDNIITALWMLACLVIPAGLKRFWPEKRTGQIVEEKLHSTQDNASNLVDLGCLLALGLLTMYISEKIGGLFATAGIVVPEILILTTIALILAQLPVIQRLKGASLMGMFGIYLFLTVVGAYCEISALKGIGSLAGQLMIFTVGIVVIHGLLIFVTGKVLGYDWQLIAVASQANIGGSTSALALTESFGRQELLIPAILVGSLGNALGSYLGFFMVQVLR